MEVSKSREIFFMILFIFIVIFILNPSTWWMGYIYGVITSFFWNDIYYNKYLSKKIF